MAIIGNQLQSSNYVSDQFSGNGSTVAYTLSLAPASAASIAVYISGLYQTPGVAYTVSGTTLTFTGAPPSGTNNIYVLHHGIQNQNLVPVNGSITPAMLNNANVVYWSVSNNNVGIGNTSPTDLLSVGGTLRAGNTNVTNLTASGNTSLSLLSIGNAIVFPDGTQIGSSVSLGTRNRAYNGDLRIAQRNASNAVSVNATSFGIHDADRYNVGVGNNVVVTTQRSTDVPSGLGFQYSKQLTVTTASSSTGRYAEISYYMEGMDTMSMGWNPYGSTSYVTVSFWAKSSVAGTYVAQLRNRRVTPTRAFSYYYTLAANTWTKVAFVVPGDPSSTWYADNNEGLSLWINLDTGSDFTNVSSPTGSWFNVSGSNYYQPFAQQWCATVGNTFRMVGVQIEPGIVATPFDFRPYGTELHSCQRYYYKFDTTTSMYGITAPYNSSNWWVMVQLPARMRAVPTVTATYTGGSMTPYINADRVHFQSSSQSVYVDTLAVSAELT